MTGCLIVIGDQNAKFAGRHLSTIWIMDRLLYKCEHLETHDELADLVPKSKGSLTVDLPVAACPTTAVYCNEKPRLYSYGQRIFVRVRACPRFKSHRQTMWAGRGAAICKE